MVDLSKSEVRSWVKLVVVIMLCNNPKTLASKTPELRSVQNSTVLMTNTYDPSLIIMSMSEMNVCHTTQ